MLLLIRSRPKGQRKGYMGHLTHIANQLTEQMEKGANVDRIKEAFQGWLPFQFNGYLTTS